MPSVEMRRSTRVFVPKAKGGELVRVLRSGRRLWVVEESSDIKHTGGKNGDEWYSLIDSDNNKRKEQHDNDEWLKLGGKPDPMDVDEEKPTLELIDRRVPSSKKESSNGERMFVNVYCRKRKRSKEVNSGPSGDKKFGLHFVRRQRRKLPTVEQQRGDSDSDGLLSIVVDRSCAGCSLFSCVFGSLLSYMMTREEIELGKLYHFLVSSPISPVFASAGIHFVRGFPHSTNRGICRIFGVKQFMPLFTVDFCAAPFLFLRLHVSMFFRSVRLPCLCSIDFHKESECSTDIGEPLPVTDHQREQPLTRFMASDEDGPKVMKAADPSCVVSKFACRNVHIKSGVTTRSASKRRRSRSLRIRRARNPLPIIVQKASGTSLSDHPTGKKIPATLPLNPKQELRRPARNSSTNEISVPKLSSSATSLNVDIDSQSCSANILVVETEKGYRVEGAEIMLDLSDSNEWVLTVKKDGLTMYCLKVHREMRPCTTNRITHAVIWAGENGWKLEFPQRKDWSVFKELYKVCGERNVVPTSPVVKFIPVPGVREVTNSWDSSSGTFKRPDSYIRISSDELSRALSNRTANYDMDSEDEEWLGKLNSELDRADEVSEVTFELIIDAFEKASFYGLEDCSDENAAVNLCLDLASSPVTEEVYRYWMKKRKQRSSPLIRVFQLNQPKRQVITKPVLRKKRSLKRSNIQPIQRGRGKDSSVLQAIAAEQTAVEEHSMIVRLEEAKASANRTMELAILKRKRAQFLMENADLAMYRATMAVRIADAAQIADTQQAATHFLD